MKVAVLMSTFNAELYICEQIESILAQIGEFKIDLWIRDDGSTDKTIELLRKYEVQGNMNVYIGENIKSARSFIDLLCKCGTYDYYCFADQDDWWFEDKIARGINKIANNKEYPSLYFSNAEIVDSNLLTIRNYLYRNEPKKDIFTLSCAGGLLGCTMIFNRKLAEIIQKRSIKGRLIMHDFFIAELCVAIDGKIEYDSKVTIKYRQHNKNVIGVPNGVFNTFKNRLMEITKPTYPGIAEQAITLLEEYGDLISEDNKEWLVQIATYKKNIYNRMKLAFSTKTKYINCNMAMKIRLAILFGNR